MKYELFDFQKKSVKDLIKSMQSMRRSYEDDGSLSAVSLIAPTGAGKTVIAAAVIEGLFFGSDSFAGDPSASILWLSDSPSLNEQTLKRFDKATDLLNSATMMETIGPDFAKNHSKLLPSHVYFLNRQLLSSKGKLSNESEGGRTFYDVLADTIEDTDIHLFLFIDEAHRGLGKYATSDASNRTIYDKLIDGQTGKNPPMPNVIGISATPQRFEFAMAGRKNRDMKAGVEVPVSEVRASGLIKDAIELRTPKEASNTKHQDLIYACRRLTQSTNQWRHYCRDNNISVVSPLLIVQVEDKISNEALGDICSTIHKVLPWLDINDCFANVFGEHENITTSVSRIPYCPPEDVNEHAEIKVLFAKDAISTGWDCPRAEVIYSRRKRNDPTYIAQLIGRMIRTPLARRIESVEILNTVSCFLPEFDSETVDLVVAQLKEDNIPIDSKNIIKNPADVKWFGDNKHNTEKKIEQLKLEIPTRTIEPNPAKETSDNSSDGDYEDNSDDFISLDLEAGTYTGEDLYQILERMPKVDSDLIKESFEGIITRQVRRDKPSSFMDLFDLIDIIMEDMSPKDDLNKDLQEDFYNHIEGAIKHYPAEFSRSCNEIRNTTVSVKRVDPLTGEEFAHKEESVQNDATLLMSYYRRTISKFDGSSDLINDYINRYKSENGCSDEDSISRICAATNCFEIFLEIEYWAEKKKEKLLDSYGSKRIAVSEQNKERWDRIEGNTKPYIERNLSIQASITRQNKDYDRYPKHIISDAEGWAYLNLNDLEKKIVEKELNDPMTVAWYRNQARNLNASLSIPYYENEEYHNMYPDFIFFMKLKDGKIVRSIVDPHGDWLSDSIPKLKGYLSYIKDHPTMFGRILAVNEESNGTCRFLDLMDPKTQGAIDSFTGSSAKELFNGPCSHEYELD